MQEGKIIGITPDENNEIVEKEKTSITTLTTNMQRFVHLYVGGQYTILKLAELLNVHPNTLHNWLKRADVRSIITELQEDTHNVVANRIKNLSTMATDKLQDLMDSPIDGVALQAVKDVLDRAGHKPKQEIKVDKTVVSYEEKLNSLINKTIDVTDYEVLDD